jgi:hypothetical protein
MQPSPTLAEADLEVQRQLPGPHRRRQHRGVT